MSAHTDNLPICGKPELMIKHLRKCQNVDSDTQNWAIDERTATEKGKENSRTSLRHTTEGTPHAKRLKISDSSEDLYGAISLSHARPSTQASYPTALFAQDDFEQDMCDLFISNNWAWNAANSTRWRRFLQRWIPGSQPVTAERLSGSILDQRYAAVKERIKPRVEGKLATGSCDGWKDIAKTNLVSSLATVDRDVRTLSSWQCFMG